MFFNQLLNPAGGGGAGAGGLGSLASLIAMGQQGGGGAAPALPQMGAVPQSGPTAGPIPPAPQPQQQNNILQQLMQMDPQKLRQLLMGMGLGSYGFGNGGGAANMMSGSPGLISSLLASPDFSGPGVGGGGSY